MNIYDHKEKYFLKLLGKGSKSFINKITDFFSRD